METRRKGGMPVRMTMAKVLLFCIAVLAMSHLSSSANYAIQAYLPLTGPDALKYQQWASAMRFSATSASALLSPDTISVDVYDYAGNVQVLGTLGANAMSNSSVIAVLADEVATNVFAPFAAAASVRLHSFLAP